MWKKTFRCMLILAALWVGSCSSHAVAATGGADATSDAPCLEGLQGPFRVEITKTSEGRSVPWFAAAGAVLGALVTGGFGWLMQRRTLADAQKARKESESLAEKLANDAREHGQMLDDLRASRREVSEEWSRTFQHWRDEVSELTRYRRAQRAEHLLTLFKALPSESAAQAPASTVAEMTKAYTAEGAGLFLGRAAPVYHWASTMLKKLEGFQGEEAKDAAHRVVSTLRTALIFAVEGNDDSDWLKEARNTLQLTTRDGEEGKEVAPTFSDMRGWNSEAVLKYLAYANKYMKRQESDGSWPVRRAE